MSVRGFDSYGAIPVTDLLAAGASFVARYVSLQQGKCITASEAAGYRNADLALVLVYEDEALDGLGGAAVGAAKAAIAAPVLDAIDWPANRPVHFAFDFASGDYASDYPTMVSCVRAFAAGIGRPEAAYCDAWLGVYLSSQGVKYLFGFGESTSGVEGPWAPATVWQGPSTTLAGQPVDPDTALKPDYGQTPWSDLVKTNVRVNIGPDGEGQAPVKGVTPASFVSATAVFGVGPKPAGAVGLDTGSGPNGEAVVTAKGWGPNIVIDIVVGYLAS